ncbi:MAG: tRNA (adenosine(37)-N6)-threonylcarbamoyltransferase complex ATPase subunit type 1 TsaE [candidate division Zixibacteria bacterium]|nr:tRNA (adenosine(37)-N6)-threonylcarbamoyltransferase complex ATPase subunit type 1 TsaE [candidate division Zixibacteria bacterium]
MKKESRVLIEKIRSSPEETKKFGSKLATSLKKGDVVALIGPLGSGKTCLVQGICAGLGVREIVTSPSFVIINQYPGRFWVYHFDLYRLKNKKELVDLGYEEFFYDSGICIIEWAEKIKELLPKKRIEISLNIISKSERRIKVKRC